jgi:hypothetical protein
MCQNHESFTIVDSCKVLIIHAKTASSKDIIRYETEVFAPSRRVNKLSTNCAAGFKLGVCVILCLRPR